MNPPYRDPEKDKKLEDAIRYGFIQRQIGPDGVYTYSLTHAGLQRWHFEKIGVTAQV